MLVEATREIELILKQIAQASERIEANQAILDMEATRGNYKGLWAETNYRKQRSRVSLAAKLLRDDQELVEYLNKKLERLIDENGTNVVNIGQTMKEVEDGLKDDPELLAFLLG